MKKLDEDIKNGIFHKVYILTGEQKYLRDLYRDKLVNQLVAAGDTMNFTHFVDKGTTLEMIAEISDTMPFMAERRVIVVEESGFFTSANETLVEFIKNIPDTTVLIFSETKADGKLNTTKAVAAIGGLAKMETPKAEDLKKWVIGRLNKEHRRITADALNLFISNCGEDMVFISNELEKLICYTFGKEGIYPEDVAAVCNFQVEDTIFQMFDAMFRHNTEEALKYYGDILALRMDQLFVLSRISIQLRLMMHLRMMDGDGVSEREMAQMLSMNEYRVKKTLIHARRSSRIWIRNSLELCADTERRIKSGDMGAQVGLESVICTLSKTAK